jgi:uncharacterized protein
MRDKFSGDLKTAMKARQVRRVGTLRLILAAIQEREHASPTANISDEEIIQVLQKMIRQRKESLDTYERAGRTELADVEREEIAIIETYLPQQMDEAELRDAVAAVVKATGAATMKDMGKVMGALKERYAGKLDLGKANGVVKELLSPK